MLNKTAGQSCGVLGRAWPFAKKSTHLVSLEDRHEQTTTKVPVPFVVVLAFAQIKPARINLSLFGRSRARIFGRLLDESG